MTTPNTPARDAAVSDEMVAAFERTRSNLGHVEIEAMQGDNLAVTLCTHFDDGAGDQDDNGWTEAAVSGCEATLAAIHRCYVNALGPLLARMDQDAATIAKLRGEIEARDAKLRPTLFWDDGDPESGYCDPWDIVENSGIGEPVLVREGVEVGLRWYVDAWSEDRDHDECRGVFDTLAEAKAFARAALSNPRS